MSNFSYEKYNEIVSSVNYLGEKLKKEGQDTYTSIKFVRNSVSTNKCS